MHQATIGEFLRAKREGAHDDERMRRRRRTPGLRREDVAERAGISTDWYTRLEQNRVAAVSDAVLDRVADALHLEAFERRYLYDLVGRARLSERALSDKPHPTAAALVELTHDLPACVINARGDLLLSNALHERLLLGYGDDPKFGRNLIWFMCCDPRALALYPDHGEDLDRSIANLRLALGRTAVDPQVEDLIDELSARSEAFRRRWAELRVKPRHPARKRISHPEVGDLDFAVHNATPVGAREQTFVFLRPSNDATWRGLKRLADQK